MLKALKEIRIGDQYDGETQGLAFLKPLQGIIILVMLEAMDQQRRKKQAQTREQQEHVSESQKHQTRSDQKRAGAGNYIAQLVARKEDPCSAHMSGCVYRGESDWKDMVCDDVGAFGTETLIVWRLIVGKQ